MIPLFELEPHREAEDDPRWKARIKARNLILISAALIVPMGALMIMAALLLGDLDMDVARPDIVMITAMVHPFLAAFATLGSLYVHSTGLYWSAAIIAMGTQVVNFSVFAVFTLLWLIG